MLNFTGMNVTASENAKLKLNACWIKCMKITGYTLCLDNTDYTVSLELRKIYPIIEPDKNDLEGYLRIVDESGEDYLYSNERFAVLNLSATIEKQIKESLALA